MIVWLMMRPPILQLTPYAFFYSSGSPFSYKEAFHFFLGGSLGEAYGRFIYIGFYILPNNNPSGSSTPSSHRMRDNPFLGQYTLKSQEIKTNGGFK
jgi:hypothetical protein